LGISCDERPLTECFDAATVPRLEVKQWDEGELAAQLERRFRVGPAAFRRAFMP
jgi:hypothetical protein